MKSKVKSVKFNMIMNALLSMSSFIFPLITFPYVSRILLPIGTGKVSFATSVVTYFAMFAQLGIPTYGIRACAKVRDDKEKLSQIAQELIILNLILCVPVYIVFAGAINLVPRLASEKTLMMVISVNILLSSLGVEWLYKALEQYSYITIRSIIFKSIALVSMFMLVHKQDDYIIYGGISIFASSASNILNFLNLPRLIYIRKCPSYNLRQHMKPVMTFFMMSVATTIYTNLDNVMLGFLTDDEQVQVGYYSAAVKIKNILISLVTSVSAVLLPRMTYYIEHHQPEEFERIAQKTMNFIVLMATPLVVYFTLFAKIGILFISGEAYEPATIPLQILMPTVLLIGMTNVLGIQIMIPLGKEIKLVQSVVAGAVVDLLLNAVLIVRLGASGAAIGTLVAEVVVLVWQCKAIPDIAKKSLINIRYVLIILASIVASCASVWILGMALEYFWSLVISAITFFGTYIIVLYLGKESFIVECVSKIRKYLIGKR